MIFVLSEVLFKSNSNYQIGKYCLLIGRKFSLVKFQRENDWEKAIAAFLLVDFSPDPHANGSSAGKTMATIKIVVKNRTSGSSGSKIRPDQVDLIIIIPNQMFSNY